MKRGQLLTLAVSKSSPIEFEAEIDPHRRRKAAFLMLLGTFILGHVNLGLFFVGVVPPALMDAITNYLSWLALTITALDLLVGTDVRVQQEEEAS